MINCPACKKELPDDTNFCKACGCNLKVQGQTSQYNDMGEPQVNTVAMNFAESQVDINSQTAQNEAAGIDVKPRGKSGSERNIIIVAVILLAAAAVYISGWDGFGLLGSKSTPTSSVKGFYSAYSNYDPDKLTYYMSRVCYMRTKGWDQETQADYMKKPRTEVENDVKAFLKENEEYIRKPDSSFPTNKQITNTKEYFSPEKHLAVVTFNLSGQDINSPLALCAMELNEEGVWRILQINPTESVSNPEEYYAKNLKEAEEEGKKEGML